MYGCTLRFYGCEYLFSFFFFFPRGPGGGGHGMRGRLGEAHPKTLISFDLAVFDWELDSLYVCRQVCLRNALMAMHAE